MGRSRSGPEEDRSTPTRLANRRRIAWQKGGSLAGNLRHFREEAKVLEEETQE
jgi:hypothetical protein